MNVDVDSFVKQWKEETLPFDEDHDLDVNVVNSRFVFATDRANPQAGILYTNNHGMEFFRWLFKQMRDPYGPELNAAGITTDRDGVQSAQQMLIENIPLFKREGFEKVEIANVKRVISTLNDTLKHKNRIESLSVVNADLPPLVRDLTVCHELVHGLQNKLEADSGIPHVSDEWVRRQPGYGKFYAWLNRRHDLSDGRVVGDTVNVSGKKRATYSIEDVGREWGAYGLTDHLRPAGFSRQETINFARSYLHEVVQVHGIKALDLIGRVSQDARDIINSLKTQYEIAQQQQKQLQKGLHRDQEDSGKTQRPTKGPKFREIEIDEIARGSGTGTGVERGLSKRIGAAIAGAAELGGGDSDQRGLRVASEGIVGADLGIEGESLQNDIATTSQAEQRLHNALPVANSPQNTATDDDRRLAVNADLIKSLQTIATIESTDPDGIHYTWRGLAVESARIAREALANHESRVGRLEVLSAGALPEAGEFSKSGENHWVKALRVIANIELLDPSRYSWKDQAVRAGTIAREALNSVSRDLRVEESSTLQIRDNHDQSWSHRQTHEQAQLIHSVDQGGNPEPQKTNEVRQGKPGIGIAL